MIQPIKKIPYGESDALGDNVVELRLESQIFRFGSV